MQVEQTGDEPILCFGGPYSNVQATEAVRREAERLSIPPNHVICTGDIVAYCANPNETTEMIREWGCHVIKGNCEEQLAERAEDCGCGFGDGTACDLLSQQWYAFANANLRDDLREWMGRLPPSISLEIYGRTARVIHGGVRDTSRFIFASTPTADKAGDLDVAAADIIIAGHSGIPFIENIGNRMWFNPGVIGMPANDGTPDGWYGLIEPIPERGKLKFSIHRLTYNAHGAASSLSEAGYANPYAEALKTGHWPSLDVLPQVERDAAGKRLLEVKTVLA